jgi:hypothetical protein
MKSSFELFYLSKVHGIQNQIIIIIHEKAKIFYFRWKIRYVHYIEKIIMR